VDRAAPPDFVGVGAQRCGTTWWYELIVAHPAVVAGPKERHFFDRFCADDMGDADVEAYHGAFPRADGQMAGEWTPRYAHDFWTPPLLRCAAPRARLLFMVRDPIERLRSGIVHQSGLTPPGGSVELATICSEAAERGRYAVQLHRLLRSFPRQQILVLQYERCLADPAAELQATYRFLGLDDTVLPDELRGTRGTSSENGKLPLPRHVSDQLRLELADDVAALASLAPELDLGLWPSFRAG
jgi:hypothetical protein